MIRSEAEYKLSAGIEALEKHLGDLSEELATLDPSAVYNARMMLAAAQGVLLYMGKDDAA